ncbi:hypothetical protein ACFQ34_01970 [Pseudonocardia benzenivorans]|uniref:Alkaline shock family protein YloU n=1 Tax=Pseudonocardia benzenivorans TaxID=228005 RepID=A0ABW3VCK6_9PSEU
MIGPADDRPEHLGPAPSQAGAARRSPADQEGAPADMPARPGGNDPSDGGDSWSRRMIEDVRTAADVATAARSVPGVRRLQPGLRGLVTQVTADAWRRLTSRAFPDFAGVETRRRGDALHVEITIVTDSRYQAASVADEVHRAALQTLSPAGRTEITVKVSEIAIVEPGTT